MQKLCDCISFMALILLFIGSYFYAANTFASEIDDFTEKSNTTLTSFFKDHSIHDAVFSKNGECLATRVKTVGDTSLIHLWDLSKKDYPLIKVIHNKSSASLKRLLVFSKDGKVFAYIQGQYTKSVYIETLNSPESKFETKFTNYIRAIDVSHDGSRLLIAYDDMKYDHYLGVFDSKTGKPISPMKKGLFLDIQQVVFNDYGTSVALLHSYKDGGSIINQVYLFDSITMTEKEWWTRDTDHIFFLPENQLIVSDKDNIAIYDDKNSLKFLAGEEFADDINAIYPRNNSVLGLVRDKSSS